MTDAPQEITRAAPASEPDAGARQSWWRRLTNDDMESQLPERVRGAIQEQGDATERLIDYAEQVGLCCRMQPCNCSKLNT